MTRDCFAIFQFWQRCSVFNKRYERPPCTTNKSCAQWIHCSYSYAICVFICCSREIMELFGFVLLLLLLLFLFLFCTQSICKCAFRENPQHLENCLRKLIVSCSCGCAVCNKNKNNKSSGNIKSVIRFIDRWISLEMK